MGLASARCTDCTNLQAECLLDAQYRMLVFLFWIYQPSVHYCFLGYLLLILNSLHYFKSTGTRQFPNVFLCTHFENEENRSATQCLPNLVLKLFVEQTVLYKYFFFHSKKYNKYTLYTVYNSFQPQHVCTALWRFNNSFWTLSSFKSLA